MNALDALFRDEVDRQAGPLRAGLQRCRNAAPDGEALFCVQALKGAARAVGLPAAEQLADALELLLGAGEAAGTLLDADQLLAADEALELIEAIAQAGSDHADEAAGPVQVQGVLVRLATSTRQGRRRSVPARPAIPTATVELFAAECEQQAAAMTRGLLELESDPQRRGLLEPLMRAAHSVKGAARVVGFDAAVTLAHAMEDQLERARRGQIVLSPDAIDGLITACDLFQRVGAGAARGDAAAMPADASLLEAAERITELGMIGAAQSDAGAAASAPAVTLEIDDDATTDPASGADRSAAVSSTATGARRGIAASVGDDQRVLRVRAGQVSRILGLAGESIVESDRLRDLGGRLAGIRVGHAALADLLDDLDVRLGSPPRNSAAGQGLIMLRLRLQDLRIASGEWLESFAAHARRSEQLSVNLFREASDTRMRPLGDGLASFPRLVRDLSRRLAKQAELAIEGDAIRIDRDILERIEAPLNHLIRNALDHGVEPMALRRAQGKPERAVLAIRARRVAGFIQIEVRDDGAGIDMDRVRARVVEMGLAEPEAAAAMDDERLFDVLFVSGFSTATRITELSGRGVGLAVVRSVMRDIGGAVQVQSQRGLGACFTLQVPVSRSVLRSVVVSIGGDAYAFSLSSIARILRVGRHEVQVVDGRYYFVQDGQTVALVDAATALGLTGGGPAGDTLQVVVISARPHHLGWVVDAVQGQLDLVLHPLDARLGRVAGVSAAAILPDGQPVVVLDTDDLCRSVLQAGDEAYLGRSLPSPAAAPQSRRILVADDSPTVLATQREALVKHGWDVTTANDGMEAWHLLKAGRFDLLISDVDMPRLDGIGLLRSVRQQPGLRTLPVVIVSYRGSAEDRAAAIDAGADAYLLKADFDEARLCDTVAGLIGRPSPSPVAPVGQADPD
jgi:two-component system, chemotaxis family, sensor histidine kinase and response regulator WspE